MTTENGTLPVRGIATPELLGQRRFRAMNTNIDLFVKDFDDVELFPDAEEVFHSLEERLSRFRPDSELAHLNESSGTEVRVSSVLFDVLMQARSFNRVTNGLFEPGVLDALEAAGYDRSFDELVDSGPGSWLRPARSGSISQMRFDAVRLRVAAPAGLRLDLGGMGKGYAVDAAAKVLSPALDFVVNAGGDLYAAGSGPDGDGWLVNVTDPTGATPGISLVRLYDQALATSTTAVRRWQRGDRVLHHLIDPRTRQPATSGVLAATVIASDATTADILAKVSLLLGPDDASGLLAGQHAAALFVMEDGRLIPTRDWTGNC